MIPDMNGNLASQSDPPNEYRKKNTPPLLSLFAICLSFHRTSKHCHHSHFLFQSFLFLNCAATRPRYDFSFAFLVSRAPPNFRATFPLPSIRLTYIISILEGIRWRRRVVSRCCFLIRWIGRQLAHVCVDHDREYSVYVKNGGNEEKGGGGERDGKRNGK